MSLFKKVAVCTDLHIGGKNNSIQHLEDCEEYIDWFIQTARENGCESAIFCGDWSHNRNNINLITLDYSIRLLEKLGKGFEQFYWLAGNHDLYHKDRREIHSSIFGAYIPGVTIVDKIITVDDVTLVPWMVGDEWQNIGKYQSRYMFGHFELPLFYMNSLVQMPNHNQIQPEHFVNQEYVFSGHFHKRQNKGKIWYVGNCFPHNYADAWDDDRGMMIMEWGQKPQFINWNRAPKYRTLKLSRLIDEKEKIMKDKMFLRVNLDIDISFEEANFLKETFMTDYDVREFSLIQEKINVENPVDEVGDVKFQSVDQLVTSQLVSIVSDQFDNKKLLEIYQGL